LKELNFTKVRAYCSRLPRFYALPQGERKRIVEKMVGLSKEGDSVLSQGLSDSLADTFIENAIGTFHLPLGIATNFCVNGEDVLVPMAVEESSVLAAASYGAKLVRRVGGFKTSSDEPIMYGQIQLILQKNCDYKKIIQAHKAELINCANCGHERLLARGGGAKDLEYRYVPEIKNLIIYLHIDTREAMGANIVNAMCERVGFFLQELIPAGLLGLRVLSNLADKRLAKAECWLPDKIFKDRRFSGVQIIKRIEQAYLFAFHDFYRASTNNKGIMNGIDPVVIATGNDWRAVEAGAHAYAARSGEYKPMAVWKVLKDNILYGCLELPMAVGIIGGVTRLHPMAKVALKILRSPSARRLAEIICSVGLSQNLAALRALSSEGIQQGHMRLHQKNLHLLDKSCLQRE